MDMNSFVTGMQVGMLLLLIILILLGPTKHDPYSREDSARKKALMEQDAESLARLNRPWLWDGTMLNSEYASKMREAALTTAQAQIDEYHAKQPTRGRLRRAS